MDAQRTWQHPTSWAASFKQAPPPCICLYIGMQVNQCVCVCFANGCLTCLEDSRRTLSPSQPSSPFPAETVVPSPTASYFLSLGIGHQDRCTNDFSNHDDACDANSNVQLLIFQRRSGVFGAWALEVLGMDQHPPKAG